MRSSCEASATNSRWRASVASVSPRAASSACSMLSSVSASSETSSSDSGCGIVSEGSRVRAIARAASVSRVIGAMARVAVARPASSASAAPPSTPSPRKTRTRFAVASDVGQLARVLDEDDAARAVAQLDRARLDQVAVELLGRRARRRQVRRRRGRGEPLAVGRDDADHRVLDRGVVVEVRAVLAQPDVALEEPFVVEHQLAAGSASSGRPPPRRPRARSPSGCCASSARRRSPRSRAG